MADFKNPAPGAKLELYTKPNCPYCAQAMKHYDAHGIAYVEYDAQNDAAARAKMFALAGGNPTVPAIVIDGVYQRSGWGDPPRG
jgi:glutaredoxin